MRIVLSSAQSRYSVGENVLIDFGVVNDGDKPFKIIAGGDNNWCGTGREWNFWVWAIDDKGASPDDPDAGLLEFAGGGIGGQLEVMPGKTLYLRVPLNRYRTIDHAGVYKIYVSNPLGWKPLGGRYPTGELSLTFDMPTAAEAAHVVEEMARLGETNWTYGKKAMPFADFRWMSAPVYATPLLELAKHGDPRAIDGIAAVATPEATATLISLLYDPHTKVAQAAGRALAQRIPYDANTRPECDFWNSGRRSKLTATSWMPEFADKARAFAIGALNGDTERVLTAAVILGGIGTAEDLPKMIAVLDRLAKDSALLFRDRKESWDPPDGARPLVDAALAVERRAGAVNSRPGSSGELLIFAHAVATDPKYRPDGWQNRFAAMLADDNPYMRIVALLSLPTPLDASLVASVEQSIAAPQPWVQQNALAAAQRCGDKHLASATEEALSTCRPGVITSAFDAAVALGRRANAYTTLAKRLSEPGVLAVTKEKLYGLIAGFNGGSTTGDDSDAQAQQIQPLWMKFIADHFADIDAGKVFATAALDPAMMPAGGDVSTPAGNWPNRETAAHAAKPDPNMSIRHLVKHGGA